MTDYPKFIICVFDGLRRDMITDRAMPRLRRFVDQGADFCLSRAVVPTSTRVNSVALGHGAPPAVTGMVANKHFDPRVFTDKLFDTGNFDHLRVAEAAYGGRFIDAVSLGEAADAAGFKTAVVGSGSAGTTRWVNPRAVELGHVGLCLRDWRSSTPADFAARILDRFGPIPPATLPNSARLAMQTDMLLDAVLPETDPDIAIVWFTDPDATYHRCGIGSPESWQAAAAADTQFGRILDWRGAAADRDRTQIIALSDHGEITATRKIDTRALFAEAGFRLDASFDDGADFAGSVSYAGALRVRDGDKGRLQALVSWLCLQPWCGLIFTAGGDGDADEGWVPDTLNLSLLQIDHARAPDIFLTLRTHDDDNAHGFSAGTYYDAVYKEGGAVHGGVHPKETSNLLAIQGSLFRSSFISEVPAGTIDVAPTILHLLGCPAPPTMTGRVLGEALTSGTPAPGEIVESEHTAGVSPRRQVLRCFRVGTTRYVDCGWLE